MSGQTRERTPFEVARQADRPRGHGGVSETEIAIFEATEKLLEEEYRTVVFSHGAPLRDNPKERLKEVVAECRY